MALATTLVPVVVGFLVSVLLATQPKCNTPCIQLRQNCKCVLLFL